MDRIVRETITFQKAFCIGGEQFPAGTYEVETTEQLLEGTSITGWRRTATTITPQLGSTARRQVTDVDPAALDKAIDLDK